MWKGELIAIFIRPEAGEETTQLPQVHAVPGIGLEGDHYFRQPNKSEKPAHASREVTLIEEEAIQAVVRDYGIPMELGQSRRNLVTRNVPLNHLVGREFQVGEVVLKGIRLCEPCSHLAALTRKEYQQALVHRGGLRAQILTDGLIRAGDVIHAEEQIGIR
ncbi:MAG TPA: MOSC domain-containing protein [Anaerolineales bacterium]|nr:MOSC domain-containing protein [Anaerolineales bacterium]